MLPQSRWLLLLDILQVQVAGYRANFAVNSEVWHGDVPVGRSTLCKQMTADGMKMQQLWLSVVGACLRDGWHSS